MSVDYINTKLAENVDLEIEQGTDRVIPITAFDGLGVQRNFAGYTAVMQIRAYVDSPDILFEMSTANGKIDTSDGKVNLIFARADFTGIEWRDGDYDLEVTSPADKRDRLMEGHFTIDPEVTR